MNGLYASTSDEQETTSLNKPCLNTLALEVDWINFLGKNSSKNWVAGIGPTM
jgi:hypothetical protein